MTLMMMAVIVFVVDASIVRHQSREVLDRYVSEGKKESKDLGERITYKGDQVWRIHKENSTMEELVHRYDEYGCT